LQRIINFGINEIIYAKRVGSITENDETNKMRQDIILMSGIKIREFDLDNVWLKKAVDVN
jgi:deoxycytidylate deaminase